MQNTQWGGKGAFTEKLAANQDKRKQRVQDISATIRQMNEADVKKKNYLDDFMKKEQIIQDKKIVQYRNQIDKAQVEAEQWQERQRRALASANL